MSNSAGFPLNWQMSMGTNNITLHPLYAKYSNKAIGSYDMVDMRTDLQNVIVTQETSAILQWLRFVIEMKALSINP